MVVLRDELVTLSSSDDIIKARQVVRDYAVSQGLSLIDQTKLVTASSELARNTLVYGAGGEMRLHAISDGGRSGVRLTFTDRGPGIADIDQAMRDGFTTGTGLGLGLGGAKRLVNEFQIESAPGKGTTVTIVRWKSKG